MGRGGDAALFICETRIETTEPEPIRKAHPPLGPSKRGELILLKRREENLLVNCIMCYVMSITFVKHHCHRLSMHHTVLWPMNHLVLICAISSSKLFFNFH